MNFIDGRGFDVHESTNNDDVNGVGVYRLYRNEGLMTEVGHHVRVT